MKTGVRRTFIHCLSIALLFSCQVSKDVTGYYSSNFAVIGFFGAAIQLNPNSTFYYRFDGDLMSDKAEGIYKLKSDTLYLSYSPEKPDEYLLSLPDSVRQIYGALAVTNYAASSRPEKLFYKNDKLFGVNKNGEVVKRAQGYSKNRKWLFWGDRYLKYRNYFLKRRPGKTIEK